MPKILSILKLHLLEMETVSIAFARRARKKRAEPKVVLLFLGIGLLHAALTPILKNLGVMLCDANCKAEQKLM